MKKILKRIALVVTAGALCATLFACVPSDIAKAKEKMAREGYTVIELPENFDGCVGGISATKVDFQDGADNLTAYLFESISDAKDFLADWDEKVGEGTAIRDGKWVYTGTEDAIEDFND